MSTTADKLLYLQGTKSAIKDAIVAKGVDVPTGTPFREYATKIGDITTGTTGSSDWVRPTEWLNLPDNIDGVQKVSILNAVFDTDSEFVAMIFEGDYTVDWGDGTLEDFVSSSKAEHKYEYSDTDLNSDTVATFGYKQCVITITPQAGNNLTLINLNTYHSVIGNLINANRIVNFLDIRINSSYCTTLIIASTTKNATNGYVKMFILEQCIIGEIADTDFSYMFSTCLNLQSSIIKNSINIINMASIHISNRKLKYIPNYDFSSVISLSGAFNNCLNLLYDDRIINTSIALNILSSTFTSCVSLKKGFVFANTSNVTNAQSMYSSCTILEELPAYNFPLLSGTHTSFAFGASSLKFIPGMTVGATATFNFAGLGNLTKILTPIYTSFSIVNNKMSATALNEMYSILPTVNGQTVTVTGNYGAATCNPTIATAKGWTVVQ